MPTHGEMGRSSTVEPRRTVSTSALKSKMPAPPPGYKVGMPLDKERITWGGKISRFNPEEIAESLSGNARRVGGSTLEDSTPISTNSVSQQKITGKAQAANVPASYETGSVWDTVKSGLKAYLPAILVIGAVVIGIVVIKSSGSGGRRR